MSTKTSRIGPWEVTATYDPEVSTSGPAEIVIRPADDAESRDLAGGISTTVLREIRPSAPGSPIGVSYRADLDNRLASLRRSLDDYGSNDDRFLARLAAVYSDLARVDHAPGVTLGVAIGRAPSTAKALIGAARKRGLLTPASPHRKGGALTEEAQRLISGGLPTGPS